MDASTAGSIPEGATLKSVRYHVPEHYTQGPGFLTYIEALEHAVTEKRAAIDRHEKHHVWTRGGAPYVPLPERITIDVRWVLGYPVDPAVGGTSGLDFVAARDHYETLDAAVAALERRKQYAIHARI